ncbi:MAG TPA: hypothetical protein VEW48_18085 [Thermoanaerobaculia bacterium]|nr:hypothetical protein [Thermoanaerobaculia bacterium]
MFRSLSRSTVAVAFVLALVLSTAPAYALPLDSGSSLPAFDTSWLDAAMNWLGDLFGGSGSAPLQSTTTSGGTGSVGPLAGSCIDPYGGTCHTGGGGGGGV